jgi:hypothetical protein
MESSSSTSTDQNMNILIKDLLGQMQSKITDSENSMVGRLDEMGAYLDDLEQSECKLL